jgi:hypothetical protein
MNQSHRACASYLMGPEPSRSSNGLIALARLRRRGRGSDVYFFQWVSFAGQSAGINLIGIRPSQNMEGKRLLPQANSAVKP